jgi:hypothetical protein
MLGVRMSSERTTVVDFVAKGDSPDEWRVVLVEEGPWGDEVEGQLRRIQERLYGCIDAAIDGQLCESFPESMGSRVVVQLDCYNVPQAAVQSFFEKFSSNVLLQEDYKDALQRGEFVRSIGFEVSFESSR